MHRRNRPHTCADRPRRVQDDSRQSRIAARDRVRRGISRKLGDRASVRADLMYRDFRDFYSERIDTTTGIAVDSLGARFDKSVVENTNDLKRRYTGVTVSAVYRLIGANRRGRQLHAVAAVGQFRWREPRERSAPGVGLPVPGIHAAIVELP